MAEPKPFGIWLREARKASGISQIELGQRANITPIQISNIERGKTKQPKPETRRALENALGLEADTPPEAFLDELDAWRTFRDAIVQAERETATGFEFLHRFGAICVGFADIHGLLNDITARKIYRLTRD